VPLRRTAIRGADLEPHLRTLRAELAVPETFPAQVVEVAT
jgi:hypothetical protein